MIDGIRNKEDANNFIAFLDALRFVGIWRMNEDRDRINDVLELLEEIKKISEKKAQYQFMAISHVFSHHFLPEYVYAEIDNRDSHLFSVSLLFLDILVQEWSDGELGIISEVQGYPGVLLSFTKDIEKSWYSIYKRRYADYIKENQDKQLSLDAPQIPITRFCNLGKWIMEGLPLSEEKTSYPKSRHNLDWERIKSMAKEIENAMK